MGPSITWTEGGEWRAIEADEIPMAQVFAILAVGAARTARGRVERAASAWIAWHDICVYGGAADTIALDEIPWEGDPEAKRAFLVRAVDSLAGDWWAGLFEVPPKKVVLAGLIRRLRAALNVYDADTGAAPPVGENPPQYSRCLLHAVPLHRYGCIVCNHDELYGALSGPQSRLAALLLSSSDPAERSEAARLLAAEAKVERSRITLSALAHVHALAVEREAPGLLRTYLLSTAGVCARRARYALTLRHVAPLAGRVSVLDGWDAAQAHSILEMVEREEPAAPLGEA